MEEGAREIVFEGADRGTPKELPVPPIPISYARSLPWNKAIQPDVLITYQMNGRDLPPDHGYPVRAIVPGYYAMASVKWLTGIHVIREPFQGDWPDIRLRVLGLSGWKARTPRVGRNEAEVGDRQATRLRNPRRESSMHSFRSCMGGRHRGE
jgi:DMSO/TMAO reductase YedYZ molybdopterin-dependent catalytic subunit